jgi:hypothetical protein
MNRHQNKGNEMKGEKMRLGSLIVALLVLCVPTQVIAEAGQKPMAKTEGGSGNDALPDTTQKSSTRNVNTPRYSTNNPSVSGTNNPQTQVAEQICESERQQAIATGNYDTDISKRMAYIQQVVRNGSNFTGTNGCEGKNCSALFSNADPTSPRYGDALRDWMKLLEYDIPLMDNKTRIAGDILNICVTRHMAAMFDAKSIHKANNTNRPSPSADIAANPSVNTPSEKLVKRVGPMTRVLREARILGEKHQDQVDQARRGKPKRHVVGAEASNCLTPQTGGGVVNSCPFAVEYSYCVFRPTKDSWSASFDCEKTKGGSWQIDKGPNSRSIMHTAGETTYWFACKYGPTLHQPDGISPADIEFQLGRGLLGRCAEWGAGGKS